MTAHSDSSPDKTSKNSRYKIKIVTVLNCFACFTLICGGDKQWIKLGMKFGNWCTSIGKLKANDCGSNEKWDLQSNTVHTSWVYWDVKKVF